MAKKKSSQLFRFLLQGDETLASRIKFVPLTNLFPCSKNLKKKIMRILFFHCKKPHASDENFFYIDAKKISALCYQLKVFITIIFIVAKKTLALSTNKNPVDGEVGRSSHREAKKNVGTYLEIYFPQGDVNLHQGDKSVR